MSKIALILCVLLFLCPFWVTSCSSTRNPKPTYPDLPTEIKIVDAKFGHRYGHGTKHLVLPFKTSNKGSNGTALVVDFLRRAHVMGARYVSNLSIYISVQINGVSMECRTSVQLAPVQVSATQPASESIEKNTEKPVSVDPYSTFVAPFKPQVTTTVVRELNYGCRKVPLIVNSELIDEAYAASNPRGVPGGISPYQRSKDVTFQETCGAVVPVNHQVKRYGYQLAALFTPPDVRFLAERFADQELEEGTPQCYEVASRSNHRLEGEIHFRNRTFESKEVPIFVGR